MEAFDSSTALSVLEVGCHKMTSDGEAAVNSQVDDRNSDGLIGVMVAVGWLSRGECD
jgi:hypothetical protein